MKKKILPIILLFVSISAFAQYEVRGGSGTPLQVPNISAPMIVYLLNGLQGAQISITSQNDTTYQWSRYKESINDAVQVPSQQIGNTSFITAIEDGYGYYVGNPLSSLTRYVWIIDYSKYMPVFHSLDIQEDEFKCETLKLMANIEAPTLKYYTPSGYPTEIRRSYLLSYNTLEWREDNTTFVPSAIADTLRSPVVEIPVDAPLTNTSFTLSGDEFARHFGKAQSLETPEYEAIAVEAHGVATRDKDKADNEFGSSDSSTDLGGSAPIDITFTAYANEPVSSFYVWKMYKLNSVGSWDPVVRYTDKTLQYTFDQDGQFRVDLEVGDRQNICADTTQTFNVTIGKTDIWVPLAFSPGTSIGVNDEFKIAYKSLLKFKCTIFNRWGTKLYEWDDPSQGWDGRVNGALVPTGAYFYIIEYTGTDQKQRVKKGAVNVLRGKQ